ncbi:SHOCT domain-containing protein [Streptomyces coryli]|nr:SHOCT domain-containing protein [Streptomyces coryli]
MSGWGWFAMSTGTILFWALLITCGVLLYRALNRADGPGPSTTLPSRHTAEQLLAERFARGEVDEDEYHRRLAVLRGGPQLNKT